MYVWGDVCLILVHVPSISMMYSKYTIFNPALMVTAGGVKRRRGMLCIKKCLSACFPDVGCWEPLSLAFPLYSFLLYVVPLLLL